MNRKRLNVIAVIVFGIALIFTAAGQAEEKPVLIIGALYGGPITDAGYNQAMHAGVIAIEKNIKGVVITSYSIHYTKLYDWSMPMGFHKQTKQKPSCQVRWGWRQ